MTDSKNNKRIVKKWIGKGAFTMDIPDKKGLYRMLGTRKAWMDRLEAWLDQL